MSVYVRGFVPFTAETRDVLKGNLPEGNLMVEALKIDDNAGVYFDVAIFDEDDVVGEILANSFSWIGNEELEEISAEVDSALNTSDEYEREAIEEELEEFAKVKNAVSVFGGLDVVIEE